MTEANVAKHSGLLTSACSLFSLPEEWNDSAPYSYCLYNGCCLVKSGFNDISFDCPGLPVLAPATGLYSSSVGSVHTPSVSCLAPVQRHFFLRSPAPRSVILLIWWFYCCLLRKEKKKRSICAACKTTGNKYPSLLFRSGQSLKGRVFPVTLVPLCLH